MSGIKKNYMFHEEIPITKYKRTEIRKRLAQNATELETLESQMDVDETDESNLCRQLSLSQEKVETGENIFEGTFFAEDLHHDIIENNDEDSYEDLCSSNENLSTNIDKEMQTRTVELLEEKTFFESISLHITRSPAELLLMTLKFALTSKLTLTALSDLLKLVNLICDTTVLPETRYTINKICGNADNVTFHSICSDCTNYLGTFEESSEQKMCVNCNARVNASNASDPCFFAMIDPTEAICSLLKTHEEYYSYILKERQHDHNHIKDIYDGELYRKFVYSLPECDRQSYATVIFNTDGAPVFKSSKFSLWPIYIILNEIPPQSRMDSTITVGLWCGNDKPEMSIFLDIFVEVMNNFSTTGINCMIKNVNRFIKIYALLAVVDTQARPAMNGSSHFNANYGCDWCLHQGRYFAGSMRYPFTSSVTVERNHNNTIEHATQAVASGQRVFGIVSASPLLNLQKFDIIEGFTPDYMHCCLAGVAKQFTDLIIGHLQKTQLNDINVFLSKIRAPKQIGRLSRPLEYKGYWKAREFENWTLYYSVPILSTIMENNPLLKHWCLLVDSLHICLKMDITFNELNHANKMLHEFVQKAETMYSLKALTYNVHQLLHLVKSIYNWGPLFAHSTFPFEAANHNLLKCIHCSKGVILQIVKYENLQRCITTLEKQVYQDFPKNVINYCQQLGKSQAKKFYKICNITYLGKEHIIENKYVQKFSIARRSKVYHKIVFQGCLFMTTHKQNKRSCNYFAQLSDGRFVQIINFIIDEDNKELSICKIIKVRQHRYSSTVFHVLHYSQEEIIKTNTIFRSCVFIEIENEAFIVTVPNTLHY